MGSISNLSAQYWNLSTSFSKFNLGTKCPGVYNTFRWNSLPVSINSSFNDEVGILNGGSGLSLHNNKKTIYLSIYIQFNILHNPATNTTHKFKLILTDEQGSTRWYWKAG